MNEPDAPQPPPDPQPIPPEPPAETQPFIATLQDIWERIKHHKIVQWTLAYLAIAYTLLHGAEMLTGSLGWPHSWVRLFTLLLILGVPIVITLAWYHGARGQQRASGTEIMIIALLLALGGAFLWRDSGDHVEVAKIGAEATSAPVVALPETSIAPDEKSIAVLPFADMSAEKNQEHMSDGIAEELLNLLAQVPELKVIARTSSFAFKNQDIDIAEIAKRLNVAHVLEGSVRTSGDKLRITAQLVRTVDSTHLWSERYDRPMGDMFAVQDEIANAIVQTLQIKLKGGTVNRQQGGTRNLAAYELFLLAKECLNEATQVSLDTAETYLKRAVELDPEYGQAWSQLGGVAFAKLSGGYIATQEAYRDIEKYAQQALNVSPENADAHALLAGLYFVRDLDWASSDREVRRALKIDPSDPEVIYSAASNSWFSRQDQEAEQLFREALSRDPLNLGYRESLATFLLYKGRYAEAEGILRYVLAQQPEREWTRSSLADVLFYQKKFDAAFSMLQQEPNEGARLVYLPVFLYAVGRQSEGDAALEEQIKYWSKECAQCIARTYAFRGDEELALEWLERAYQARDSSLINVTIDDVYHGLADDPRFGAFLRKLKIPVMTPQD